ncbi:MAG TPA: RpiB/LacA/LacB family sugar-phosphate isomerase [Acidobacteriota bacterium]|nr:RpiB/LacA/LacB family sugar-phosphate isomerase [Acidobacteriota bacterium]
MRVVFGADHAGFELKEYLIAQVRALGHEIIDVGANSTAPADYSDFAEAVGMAIIRNQADRGILICGSGVGAVASVNKIPGIRAGICHDCYSARQGVEHDEMNVLVLGARVVGFSLAHDLARIFLGAKFSEEDRHKRRIEKLKKLEDRFLKKTEPPHGS